MKNFLWRSWHKYITLAVILFTVALAASVTAISILLPPEKVKSASIQFLSERFNRPVQIEDAHVKWWPLGVELKGLKLGAPQDTAFSRSDLISLPSLRLQVDLSQLLRFHLRIKEVRFVDLQLNYEVLADGRTNLDGLTQVDTTKKTSKPINWKTISLPGTFRMDSLVIENASIHYLDKRKGQELTLSNLSENMSLDLDSTLENIQSQGRLSIQNIKLNDKEHGIREGGIKVSFTHEIKLNLRQQNLIITQASAGLQGAQIRIWGQAQNFIDGPIVANVNWQSNQINLAEIFAAVPKTLNPELPKLSIAGTIQTQGEAHYTAGKDTSIQIELHAQNIAASDVDVPAKVQSLGFDLFSNTDQVRLEHFNADADGQKISMELKAHGLRSQAYLDALSVDANVQLERLAALAEKFGVLPDGYKISGVVDAHIKGQGPLDPLHPEKLQVSGQIQLNQIVAKAPQLPDVLNYTGHVDVDNRQIKQSGRLVLGTTQVDQEANVTDYLALALPKLAQGKVAVAQVKVSSPMLDVDKLMLMMGSKPKTESAPMTSYPSLPQNIRADLTVNVDKATAKGFDLTQIKSTVHTNGNQVNAHWNANLYTGTLSQDLSVNILSPSNAQIHTKFVASNVEAHDFVPKLADQLNDSPLYSQIKQMKNVVSGKADINADLSLSGAPQNLSQSLDGTLSLRIHHGQIQNCPQVASLTSALNKGIQTLQTWVPGNGSSIKPIGANGQLSFAELKGDLAFEKGSLVVKNWNYSDDAIGLVLALGKVGLDTKLNMNMNYLLPDAISKSLLQTQSKAIGGASQLVKGISLPQGLSALPVQNNKVALAFLIGGTLAQPLIQLDMDKTKSMGGSSIKDALKTAINTKVDSVKNLAQAKVDAQKQIALAKADSVKKAAQARVDAQKQKVQDDAKNQVKQQVQTQTKGVLKKFGF